MSFVKRIVLYVLLNLAVLVPIALLLHLFGLDTIHGPIHSFFDFRVLLGICLAWSLLASIAHLLLAKVFAKWIIGVTIIESKTGGTEGDLFKAVARYSKIYNLKKAPEVGTYPSNEVNAFSVGRSRNHALIAISQGALSVLEKEEVDAVIAHEISQVASGDMVTMTLLQGVINAFIYYFASIVYIDTLFVDEAPSHDSRAADVVYGILKYVLLILFGIVAMPVACWYSRRRQFQADEGGASKAGRQTMLATLRRLDAYTEREDDEQILLTTLKIHHNRPKFLPFLATHPKLEERIAKMQNFSA